MTLGLLLMVGVFLFVAIPKPSDQGYSATVVSLAADGKVVKSSDFFVRPYVSDYGETGIAFVGGMYPIIDHSLPRIEFGQANGARRLQIAMVTDWTKPECLKSYQLLHDLYAGEDGQDLPGIELYVLPVSDGETGKSLHEAVLVAHFGSNQLDTFTDILAEVGAGKLSADAAAVRKRVSEIDPDLATRWESLSSNLTDRFSYAFKLAFTQHKYDKMRLNHDSIPQLLVFDSVLSGQPTPESLAEFLRTGASHQHSYLTSPEGALPLVLDRSCNCTDPNHDHSLLRTYSTNPSIDALIKSSQLPFSSTDFKSDPPPRTELTQRTSCSISKRISAKQSYF